MNVQDPCASDLCDQVSVHSRAGQSQPSDSLTNDPPLRPTPSKDFFLNLKEEMNLLITIEQLDILGYLYFFIENFTNPFKMSF